MRESKEGGAAAAAAIIVAVLLVLIAYYYFFVLVPASAPEPGATFSEPKPIGDDEWVVVIDSVYPSRSLYHYRATLYRGDSYQTTLEPLTQKTSKITFVDKDGDWQLSDDDYFVLDCDDGGDYWLEVVHTPDGKVLGSVQWESGM